MHFRRLLTVVSAWLLPLDLGLLCLLSHCSCARGRDSAASTQVKFFVIWVLLPSLCLGAAQLSTSDWQRERGHSICPCALDCLCFNPEQKWPSLQNKGKQPWGFLSGQGSVITRNKLNRWWPLPPGLIPSCGTCIWQAGLACAVFSHLWARPCSYSSDMSSVPHCATPKKSQL